jgi:hypothetical protein
VNGAMVFIFRFISFSAYVVWFIPFFLFVPRFFHSLVAIPFAGIARIASIIAGAIQVPILVLPWAIHRDAESAYELMVRLVRAVDNSLFVVMTLYLIVLLFIARRNEKRDPLIVRIIKVLPVYTAIFLPGFAYEVLITHSSQDYQAPQPFIFVRLYYASVTVACIIQFLQYYAKRAEALQSLLARYSSDQEYAKSNKYRKSNLAEEESRELFGRLRKMIEDERLYADTDITPSELAALARNFHP